MNSPIDQMAPTAARLACAVAQFDIRESHDILGGLSKGQLQTLAVILAASVDLDKPLGTQAEDARKEPTKAAVYRIAACVAIYTGISVEDIYSKSRLQPVVNARQLVCWLAEAEGIQLIQIGAALGRDHSTVIHSITKVTKTPDLLTDARAIQDEMKGLAA